jgi:hypothetical protein
MVCLLSVSVCKLYNENNNNKKKIKSEFVTLMDKRANIRGNRNFSIYAIISAVLRPGVHSASNRN